MVLERWTVLVPIPDPASRTRDPAPISISPANRDVSLRPPGWHESPRSHRAIGRLYEAVQQAVSSVVADVVELPLGIHRAAWPLSERPTTLGPRLDGLFHLF